jgi:hypothetical protein
MRPFAGGCTRFCEQIGELPCRHQLLRQGDSGVTHPKAIPRNVRVVSGHYTCSEAFANVLFFVVERTALKQQSTRLRIRGVRSSNLFGRAIN